MHNIKTILTGLGTVFLRKDADNPVTARGNTYQFTMKVKGMGLATFKCSESFLGTCLDLVEDQSIWFVAEAQSHKYFCKKDKKDKWFNYWWITEMVYKQEEMQEKLKELRIADLLARREADQRELEALQA